MITINDDYFGGEQGFKSILNDYYENAINELPDEDQLKARHFIEEGLIVAGRRVGMTEGVEKVRYEIDAYLLKRLLDSRLIRAEITHLGRSFEVSHDTLVEPIIKSYEERRAIELELLRIAELKKNRRQTAVAVSIAALGIGLSITTGVFYFKAERQNLKITTQYNRIIQNAYDQALNDYINAINSGLDKNKIPDYENALISFDNAKAALNKYRKFLIETNLDTNKLNEIRDTVPFYLDTLIIPFNLDTLINNTKEIAGRQIQFNTLISQGDNFASRGDLYLVNAKEKYVEARGLNYDNNEAQIKINNINDRLVGAFERFKKKGEDDFRSGGIGEGIRSAIESALNYFLEAKKIRGNDAQVNERIKQIREILKNN